MEDSRPLLKVEQLRKYYPVTAGLLRRKVAEVKAIDGMDFELDEGETLGLAGESGCGKSTVVRCISRLVHPTSGRVLFRTDEAPEFADAQGMVDLSSLPERQLKVIRKDVQVIFQDPDSSLNPRMTIKSIVGEPFAIHHRGTAKKRKGKIVELLEMVGLDSSHLNRFPHELSGGQKQRVGVARALALGPKLILADEPVSALDMSIQGQILNLLEDIKDRLSLTFLFIAHDLSVLSHICNRLGIMYLGNLLEMAETRALFASPKHPYTEALLSAIPQPDPERTVERTVLKGSVPSPLNKPSGCPFHPRCNHQTDICRQSVPVLRDMGEGRHCACHLAEKLDLHGTLEFDVTDKLGLE